MTVKFTEVIKNPSGQLAAVFKGTESENMYELLKRVSIKAGLKEVYDPESTNFDLGDGTNAAISGDKLILTVTDTLQHNGPGARLTHFSRYLQAAGLITMTESMAMRESISNAINELCPEQNNRMSRGH